MIMVTSRKDDVVKMIGKTVEHIKDIDISLYSDDVNVLINLVNIFDINIPPEIIPEKYCYTEKDGFYLNPNYVEQDPTNTYGIPDEVYHAIIDDYTAEIFGGEV